LYADNEPGKNDEGCDSNPEGSCNGEKSTEQEDSEPATTKGEYRTEQQEREEVKSLRARPEARLQVSHVHHKTNEYTYTKPDKW
jgi:hypothetical protein